VQGLNPNATGPVSCRQRCGILHPQSVSPKAQPMISEWGTCCSSALSGRCSFLGQITSRTVTLTLRVANVVELTLC